MEKILSNYSGSKLTYKIVKKEITNRFGQEEAEKYDPYRNTLTYKNWLDLGYRISPGEKAIKSKVLIEKIDPETNKKIKHFRSVNLFFYKQVEKNN